MVRDVLRNPVDFRQLGTRLLNVFPALGTITPLRVLGSGFNSTALETAEGLVFRIGKHDLAAQGYAREARLLPMLSSHLPLPIPVPQWVAPASPDFPGGVIGYRKLPGTPLHIGEITPAIQPGLAAQLATFLVALHGFPLDQVGSVDHVTSESYQALRDDVLPTLRDTLTENQYAIIARWWETFLAAEAAQNYPPVLQHGDLWCENILIDEAGTAITGIIDFENIAVGDTATDFAALLYIGETFVAQLIRRYRDSGGNLGADFHHRLSRQWELRDFGGIQFSLHANDTAELADAIRKICEGPILNPRPLQV